MNGLNTNKLEKLNIMCFKRVLEQWNKYLIKIINIKQSFSYFINAHTVVLWSNSGITQDTVRMGVLFHKNRILYTCK